MNFNVVSANKNRIKRMGKPEFQAFFYVWKPDTTAQCLPIFIGRKIECQRR